MFDERTAGASLRIEDRGRRVVRDLDSFCNGVVFSRTRLEVGAMYSLEISTGGDWSGALRLGVTTVPHSKRPQPPPRSRGMTMPQPHYDPLSSPPMSGRSTPKVRMSHNNSLSS